MGMRRKRYVFTDVEYEEMRQQVDLNRDHWGRVRTRCRFKCQN